MKLFRRFSDWVMNDRVQNILPQNMAPWQIDYFKVKDFGKTTEAKMSLWPSLNISTQKQNIKPSRERCLPYTQRKGGSLSLKTSNTEKNLNKQASLCFPQFTALTSCSVTYIINEQRDGWWKNNINEEKHEF